MMHLHDFGSGLLLLAGLALLGGLSPAGGRADALTAEIRSVEGTPTLFVHGQPYSPLMFYGTLRLGGRAIPGAVTREWRRFSTTFVAAETQPNTGLHLRLGGGKPGTVWVDDVTFVDLAQPERNLVRRGTFAEEGWREDWVLFVKREVGAEATAHREGEALRVEIQNGGQAPWHVHLYQVGHRLEQGHTYAFSARLRADPPRTVELLVVEQGGDWTHYTGREVSPGLEEIERAARAGVHLHSFGLPLPWGRNGQPPDFTATDALLEAVLARDPKGLLLPRFGLEPPGWWKEQHPEEVMLYDDGSRGMVCVASEVWRREANEALRAFVTHLEAKYGEHILGYHPCGQNTGEWFYDQSWSNKLNGFSPAMNRGFRAWVRRKYGGDVTALRRAWGEAALTFEAVTVPSREERLASTLGAFRDPVAERKLVDWYEYKQVAMVEPLEQFARTIKEATKGRKLTVYFYGYLFDMSGIPRGPQTSGHLALARLLDCPEVDVLCSPISYFDRGLGGSGPFMVPVDSVASHGKLWLNEDDTRTYLSSPQAGFGRVDTPEQTRWVHTRNLANILVRRLTCWWMDLPGLGWLNADDIWAHLSTLKRLYDRDLGRPSRYTPEVAVVVDEKSLFYLASSRALTRPLLYELRASFNRLGAPVGIYLLNDLVAGRVPEAKLYLFPNAFALTGTERAALARTVRREGKVSVWFYGAGFLRDTAEVAHMSDLLEFPLTLEREPEPPQVQLTEAEHPLLADLQGKTFGTPQPLTPLFIPAEGASGVKVLGRYRQSGRPAVAVKTGDGYTTLYLGTLTVPATLLRNCARLAGVWLYADAGEVVQTDGRWLALTASEAGLKTVRLPRPASVRNALTGELLGTGIREWRVELKKGETRLYEIGE